MKRLLITLSLVIATSSSVRAAEIEATPGQQGHSFQTTLTQSVDLDYLLHLPTEYSKSKKQWPLILFLHGAGERGDDLSKVAVHGPPNLVSRKPRVRKNETDERKSLRLEAIQMLKEGFIIVSPQCAAGDFWHADHLAALLDRIESKHRVDPKRIYLTGLSMGGYGSWDLGFRHPGRFAAMAPICGGANTIVPLLHGKDSVYGPQQKRLPIWVFHGGKDPVVVPEESQRLVGLMKRLGNTSTKLTIYPNARHDSWTETYANPELYRWFLSHSLP